MDATCAPADIKYPTDLTLANDAPELTEGIIDQLRKQQDNPSARPRTKSQICRKRYLEIIKHLKCAAPKRRGALRFLLNAVRRNLEFIDVLQRQSDAINESTTGNVGSEITSCRALDRQFASTACASDLQSICQRDRERNGHYPEVVLADKLFRDRENLRYCAEHGIRLSSPKFGRPTKVIDPEVLKQRLADNSARNAIEGKFGQCKRRLGPGRVMARRKDSLERVIAITILTANLIRWGQEAARLFFCPLPAMYWRINIVGNNGIDRMAA